MAAVREKYQSIQIDWPTILSIIEELKMGLLDSVFGGGNIRMPPGMATRRGGMSPMTMALLGALLYRKFKGSGRFPDLFNPQKSQGPSGSLSGSDITGGLQDLLDRFKQRGYGDKAESWVKTGTNVPIAPRELEEALGEDRIKWLTEQTSLSREELLEGLSRELPETVDKLTPEGHLPTEQEAQRLI